MVSVRIIVALGFAASVAVVNGYQTGSGMSKAAVDAYIKGVKAEVDRIAAARTGGVSTIELDESVSKGELDRIAPGRVVRYTATPQHRNTASTPHAFLESVSTLTAENLKVVVETKPKL